MVVDYSGDGAWVELYKFTLADATVQYYTSFHDDILWSVDSNTYLAIPINRTTKSRTFNLAPSEIMVTLSLDDSIFDIDNVKNNKLMDNCALVIYKVERGTDTNWSEVMSGVVGDVQTNEIIMSLKIEDELLSNKRRLPRRRYSATCEHVFCGTDCGLTLSDWKETGTADAGSDTDTIVDAARAEAAGYFDGGYVEITSGDADGEKRQVKTYTVGNIELLVPFTASIAAGVTYDIYPHCQHIFTAKCDTIFSNTDNNGAFKNIPTSEEVYT